MKGKKLFSTNWLGAAEFGVSFEGSVVFRYFSANVALNRHIGVQAFHVAACVAHARKTFSA